MSGVGPSDLGWQEIHVAISLTVLTVLSIILRFTARYVRKNKMEIDDWLALASSVLLIAMLAELILWATEGGSGYHFGELIEMGEMGTITNFFKIFLANEFTYAVTSPMVKLTLLFFYRRLFPTQRFKQVADVLSVMCFLWGAVTIIVVGAQCMPLEHYWDPMVPGTCINQIAFVEGIQGINIFLDLAILCMPMPMVWNLHRPWQDRLSLSAVFLLGGFVCGASIYRLVAITQINAQDMTYTTVDGVIWTYVEPCIGLICASLPIIRGLFPAFAKRTTTGARHYYNNSNSRNGPFDGFQSAGHQSMLSHKHDNERYIEMESSRTESPINDAHEVKSEGGFEPVDGNRIHVRTTVDVV